MTYFILHFLNSEDDETVCELKRGFPPVVGDKVWLPCRNNAWEVRDRWIAFDHEGDPDAVVMTVLVKAV